MTLAKKAALISILVMAAMTLIYFGIFRLIVLRSFLELDAEHARRDTARCEAALAREIKHLNDFTHDWASWDETCRFMAGYTNNFIQDNLQDQVFEDQKLNLIHIYDGKGHLFWGKAYDLDTHAQMPLDLEAQIGAHAFKTLIHQNDPATSTCGIVATRQGILMVSANPILTSQNKGPSRGAFVMGRLFTKKVLSTLSEQVNVRIDAFSAQDPRLPREMGAVITSMGGSGSLRLVEASPSLMHTYSLVRDIRGRPALLMRASIPRDIMGKGTWAYRLGLFLIMGMGFVTFICMTGMLKCTIVHPISNLIGKVVAVRESGNAAMPFETDRHDEIGSLSREFSAVMKRLDKSQSELREHRDLLEELVRERTLDLTRANHRLVCEIEERKRIEKALLKSEEKYLTHFSLANDVLYVINPDFTVESISPSVERVLGITPGEMVGRQFQDLGVLHPDDLELAAADTMHVLSGGHVVSRVYRFFSKAGEIRYGEVSSVPFMDEGGITGCITVARDITEHKKAEQCLMVSEEKYRTILESIEETYFELDLKGNFTFFSDPLCRALGYSREELTGMNYRAIVTPADRKEIHRTFHGIFMTGSPKTFINFQVITRTGERRFAELSASLLRSLTGEITGFRGIWRDVTDRIHSEQTIKESEQRYRRITSSITGYIYTVFVEDGRAVRTVHGPACVAVTGYTPEEFEADPYLWCTMVPDEDRKQIQEHASLILTGEHVGPIEHRILRKDGAIRWVCNTPVLHYDPSGRLTSFDGVINDITARKLAEEELKKSEERYRITLQSMSDAVSILRISDHRCLYVNDGFCTMTGYSCSEALGKTFMDLNLPAQDQDSETLSSVMSLPEGALGIGARFLTRQNKILDTLISTRPVQYEDENCMVVVLTDITALKRAEEQKKELELMLSQAQKMEAIGTLAGGIAHDFNNILTAIIGYTGMAMRCISDQAKATKKLEEAIKASERAKDLVSQILAFSRKSETKYKPLALHSALKESLKMLRALIPTTIDIRPDFRETIHVMADSTKIHQVMMNLCTNAAHSMQDAGGVLEVALCRTGLHGDSARLLKLPSGAYAEITVKDTGYGMGPEVSERIFEPYFTTKEKGRGTGLGLSVVHGIVKSHKGAITCMSEPGVGTEFHIYLPEIEYVPEVENLSKTVACPAGIERILFVDDEPTMVEVVEEMLQSIGYAVVTSSSSVDALNLFQERPTEFDLVITDMTMPLMTGDRLALKLLEVRPDIPIILCTGYSEQINEEKAYAMGIRAFIMKPLDLQKLGTAVRKVMDGRGSGPCAAVRGCGTC